MLEYLTRVPSVLKEVDPSLPSGYPFVWYIGSDNDDPTISHYYIRDGKIHYYWEPRRGVIKNYRTWVTTSPAVTLTSYASNVVEVLCTDLTRYLIHEETIELLPLRDPLPITRIEDYTLNGYPSLPLTITMDNWENYRW